MGKESAVDLLLRFSSECGIVEECTALVQEYFWLLDWILVSSEYAKNWLRLKGWRDADRPGEGPIRRKREKELCSDIGLLQPYYSSHIYENLREAVALELSHQIYNIANCDTVVADSVQAGWLIAKGWAIGKGEYSKIFVCEKVTRITERDAVITELKYGSWEAGQ